MPKRFISYSRVSSQEQSLHGYSLEMMEKQCQEYATFHGGEIVRKYVDAGYSGTLPPHRRPALHSLLEDIKTRKDVESLILWRLDRLSRHLK